MDFILKILLLLFIAFCYNDMIIFLCVVHLTVVVVLSCSEFFCFTYYQYKTLEAYFSCKMCAFCYNNTGEQKNISAADILIESVTTFSVYNFNNYNWFLLRQKMGLLWSWQIGSMTAKQVAWVKVQWQFKLIRQGRVWVMPLKPILPRTSS